MNDAQTLESDIPARLDRLAWTGFHTRVAAALGVTWVLDGLEVTLAGAVAGAVKAGLHLSDAQVGWCASAYLAGAVIGGLLFGALADRLGRKPLFFVTLGLYLGATLVTGLAPDFASYALFRFLTGAGIGGEYTAISSAIQELTPARYRGHTDLMINGSFWIGAALGAGGAVLLLDPRLLPPGLGWRCAYGMGALLGCGVLLLRRAVPESPRWLLVKGRAAEAAAIVARIERQSGAVAAASPRRICVGVGSRRHGLTVLLRALFRQYPRRAVVCTVLMTAQAFFYNAIFFTYALVLGRFFTVPPQRVGLYILPFAAGNFLGPLLLGRWFDTLGRRPMLAATYATSGVLMLAVAALFMRGALDAAGLTVAWSAVFFFASAAASGAYLTVGESFPLEVRALAIAVFYVLGIALGGIAGPALFGALVGGGERRDVALGYAFGAVLMLVAALVVWLWAEAAERRSLEDLAQPLILAGDRERYGRNAG